MRSLTASLVLGVMVAGGAAGASPIGGATAQRRPPRADMPVQQLERFVRALGADRRGELADAIHHYEGLLHWQGFAEVHYNLADAYRRSELVEKALEQYRLYLKAAPDAPDRKAIEKLIATLEGAPSIVVLGGSPPGAILFLDGKRVASPFTGPLADGEHHFERISATTFERREFRVKHPTPVHEDVHGDPRTGNVVITSGASELGRVAWKDGDIEYRLHEPFALKAGKYRTLLVRENLGCSALAFEVAPPPALTYVYVTLGAKTAGGCHPVTVTQETVTFSAESP